MQKYKTISAIILYAVFMLIGHHGPFALHHKSDDHHPHTHKKHVVKLLKTEEDFNAKFKTRKLVPLST